MCLVCSVRICDAALSHHHARCADSRHNCLSPESSVGWMVRDVRGGRASKRIWSGTQMAQRPLVAPTKKCGDIIIPNLREYIFYVFVGMWSWHIVFWMWPCGGLELSDVDMYSISLPRWVTLHMYISSRKGSSCVGLGRRRILWPIGTWGMGVQKRARRHASFFLRCHIDSAREGIPRLRERDSPMYVCMNNALKSGPSK